MTIRDSDQRKTTVLQSKLFRQKYNEMEC